jgi:TatD DNase family protein
MKLFDSHCHLNDAAFKNDLADVLARARAAGVRGVMTVGAGAAGSEMAVSMARSIPGCIASVGIHPHRAKDCSESVLSELADLAGTSKVRAWGEIGLDFNRMYSPRKDQEKWFVRQLGCADALGLPVIFHERDSGGRFLEILNATHRDGRTGVIHCFSGDTSELNAYLGLGYHVGVTGVLTMTQRGADLRRRIARIPPERILIETDAPYLTPNPENKHTRRNEPAFVRSVLYKLAEVKGKDPVSLSDTIWRNTLSVYRITEDDIGPI